MDLEGLVKQIVCHFAAVLVLNWGNARWIPKVVNRYGFRYFDWKEPWFPSLLGNLALGAVQMAIVAAAASGKNPACLPFLALMAVALTGIVRADLRFHLIPDRFQIAGLVGAVGYVATTTVAWDRETLLPIGAGLLFAGALQLVNVLYTRLRKREALGFGDVKLLAWLGVALGTGNVLAMLYGVLVAIAITIPLLIVRVRNLGSTFAFGPYIVLGCLIHAALQLA